MQNDDAAARHFRPVNKGFPEEPER